jgi:hypothetical protein
MTTRSKVEKFSPRPRRGRVDPPVGRPRTRKPKAGETQQMSIALDGAVIAQLDEELEKLNAERRGPAWTRTDLVREAVDDWLAARRSKRGGK